MKVENNATRKEVTNEAKDVKHPNLERPLFEEEEIIDGLYEIRRAFYERQLWREKCENANEDWAIAFRNKPKTDISALLRKYPRAAAYLKAETFRNSEHYVKAKFGRTAMERIIDGDDYSTVIREMEKGWHDYCMEHVWD